MYQKWEGGKGWEEGIEEGKGGNRGGGGGTRPQARPELAREACRGFAKFVLNIFVPRKCPLGFVWFILRQLNANTTHPGFAVSSQTNTAVSSTNSLVRF